jgi:hypothetical protein
VDKTVVSNIIQQIESKFGKMSVTRGRSHTFLGMKIEFSDKGTLTIDMKEYIVEAIKDFCEDVSLSATTPAKRDLFDVNSDATPLDKQKMELFHSIVAKLLYIAKRGRIDILLAVAFLCTRVSCSTSDDWNKLKRVLQYLNRTVDEVLTLGADCMTTMRTWVDAAYGVHSDMKSHTGGVMSFGIGAVMCKSSKQKLNTKSSTEAELVGASDFLPTTIWSKMFLKEQGYNVTDNIFAQDNQSAMRLETNGRASCGQKSRHIDIRYFFMKDRIKSEQINILYCPTEEMLADFFTKPLQGSLFNKFKQVLLGNQHISTLKRSPSTAEERVGKGVFDKNEKVAPEDDDRVSKLLNEKTSDAHNGWTFVKRANRSRYGSSNRTSDNEQAIATTNNSSSSNEQHVHSFKRIT